MKAEVEGDRVVDEEENHVGTVLEKGGWRKKGRINCFKCDKTVESRSIDRSKAAPRGKLDSYEP